MEKYTIDELLDVLQWARDRATYFRACNKPMPGALYAADCKAERDAEAELYRRGYYTAWDGIASPPRRKHKRQVNIAGRAEKSVANRWAAENRKKEYSMENIKKRFEKLSLHDQNYINGRKKYCEKWSIPFNLEEAIAFFEKLQNDGIPF